MIRRLFIFIMLSAALVANAQHEDLRSWISLEVEGEAFDLIDFSISPEVRLMNNSTQIDAVLTEVDLSVPVTKFLRTGIEYRYKLETDNNRGIQNNNRGGIYLELHKKINHLRLAYRAMYLMEYTDILTREHGTIPEELHRHKLSLKYHQKGWDITPAVSAEAFFTINPLWNRNENKWRFTAGIQYRITKDLNLGVSYKLQKEFNQNDPLTLHILDVGLEYEL